MEKAIKKFCSGEKCKVESGNQIQETITKPVPCTALKQHSVLI